ncbi:MAG: tRNA1(Val) (adenine(37)-N6)-methyltransferase [Deltaproteobacteria bacterium]|nr:tRNA1(Val) (adenine(37)-N6)-methyltransferase [Deltaproteobacteria bacterium]
MRELLWDEREETLDTLFEGRLKILQRKDGYRFSIDALLLAHFAEPRSADRIIDLGTGCGIIPLILIFRKKAERVIGVEIQPSLANLARRNAALNRLSNRIQVLEKDLKNLEGNKWKETFDLAISNPPYRKVGAGRINPQIEKALARHEIKATLEDVLHCAYYLLKEKGRLIMIYPASRAIDLLQEMRRFHLEPKRLQFVHSHMREEARLFMVEALKEGHAQVKVLAPFFVYGSEGKYTPEAQKLFR